MIEQAYKSTVNYANVLPLIKQIKMLSLEDVLKIEKTKKFRTYILESITRQKTMTKICKPLKKK